MDEDIIEATLSLEYCVSFTINEGQTEIDDVTDQKENVLFFSLDGKEYCAIVARVWRNT